MKVLTHIKLASIALVLSSCATSANSDMSLADKNASAFTKNLYHRLIEISGKSTMFGHQDATVYGIGWKYIEGESDVKRVSGDYPAVYGWDIGHLELGDSVNLDSVSFSIMRQHIQAAFKRGGVNTASWHLRNPLTGGSSWDVTSNRVVASILPGGERHDLYLTWLNRLAEFFTSLKADDGELIPILFRPFHEHSGSWFWWGKNLCTTDEYKQLVRFTIDYLKDTKQVHNLIYVYSPDVIRSEEEYWERYPGDEYIDVLGIDMYNQKSDSASATYMMAVSKTMEMLKRASEEKRKPFVFSETGLEGITNPSWYTQVLYKSIEATRPAYVLVWRNAYERPSHHYAPYPGHPSVSDFLKFKKQKGILFEGDLPQMYRAQ